MVVISHLVNSIRRVRRAKNLGIQEKLRHCQQAGKNSRMVVVAGQDVFMRFENGMGYGADLVKPLPGGIFGTVHIVAESKRALDVKVLRTQLPIARIFFLC